MIGGLRMYRRWKRGAFYALALAVCLAGLACRSVPFTSKSAKKAETLALNREGIAAFERSEYELAQERFAQAVKNDEADLTSQRYYAETLWMQGKKEEAVRRLVEISKADASTEEALAVNRSIAEKLLSAGQPISALNYAEKTVSLAPERFEGWALRGNVYWQLGKTEEALADYHKALHFAPDDRNLLWQMAILEDQAGRSDRSLATWQRLGRLYPGNTEPVEVLCGKGLAYRRLKRYDESVRHYEAALAQSPDLAEIYPLLADVYLDRDDWASAAQVARRAEALFPANPQMREFSARIEQLRLAAQSAPKENLR